MCVFSSWLFFAHCMSCLFISDSGTHCNTQEICCCRRRESFFQSYINWNFTEVVSISFSHTRSWTLSSNTHPAVKILCDHIMTRRHLQSILLSIKGASTTRFVVALIVMLRLGLFSHGLLGFLVSVLKKYCTNDNGMQKR